MKIIVDIGNTKLKFAVFEDQKLEYKSESKAFQLAEWKKLFQTFPIDAYIISSVKGNYDDILNFLQNECERGMVLSNQSLLPLTIDYETPETLGIDRLALAVAAVYKFPNSNTLVISCGTCITYNLITHDRKFVGGAISPGVHMRLKAMHHFTDKLPQIDWDGHLKSILLPKNTRDAMLSGAVNGALCELTEVINRYRQTFTRELNIILCGGDAKFFEKELKNSIFADSNFVLYGLNEILQYNS
ncbi:type III pantothenate kinase [Acidiluteibacter ferrifornacis]|uniref:Type III pantothenate kinase n=1 Tax=Acidiluteibacter ferrifornacis TaxID=2692424 RepID=A0A6N9NEX7_9FLAO|nr:type III pantothenate kinase [Acidiluteibacter ferrifornacis]NBG65178.1 type III pantothenate kinase [Acidiluteibacter ferrifornacis]